MIDEAETDMMINAQKERLSPRLAKGFYKLRLAANPYEMMEACIDAFGFGNKKNGKPDICQGTTCLENGPRYIQYWNDEGDAMFIIQDAITVNLNNVSKLERGFIIFGLTRNREAIYYAGPEENLSKFRIGRKKVKCPSGECTSHMPLYQVDVNLKDYLIGGVSDRDYKTYTRIVENGLAALAAKRQACCEACKEG